MEILDYEYFHWGKSQNINSPIVYTYHIFLNCKGLLNTFFVDGNWVVAEGSRKKSPESWDSTKKTINSNRKICSTNRR